MVTADRVLPDLANLDRPEVRRPARIGVRQPGTSSRAAPRSSAAATSLPSIWSTKGLMITVAAAATTIATVSRNASNELILNAHAVTH